MNRITLNEPIIRHVSDTALWVAVYRAMESERPDALFKDPYACRMAGKRGQEIARSIAFGQSMAWSIIVRTAVMDEVILACIDLGARTVVNFGAGLDTRAFRLELPPTLRWLDVDLPDMIAYRRECLHGAKAACHHAHVTADLSDAAARSRALADAQSSAGPMLVVTEGLLVYLTEAQVCQLAEQIRDESETRWWVTDLITPMLSRTMGSIWRAQLGNAGAPFQFAPSDSKAFFEPLGWLEKEFHSTWSDSIRLNRPAPQGVAWDTMLKWSPPSAQEALKRMSGISLLERNECRVN